MSRAGEHLRKDSERTIGSAGALLAISFEPAEYPAAGNLVQPHRTECGQKLEPDIGSIGYESRRLEASSMAYFMLGLEVGKEKPC